MGQLLLILAVALIVGAVVFGVAVLISGADPGLEPAEPDGRAVPLPGHRPLLEEDVARVRFDMAVRGYRMGQVDQALRRAAYDIGYKDELITVLEAEVAALRSGRGEDAEVLRRAREAALAGPDEPVVERPRAPRPEPIVDLGEIGEPVALEEEPGMLSEAALLGAEPAEPVVEPAEPVVELAEPDERAEPDDLFEPDEPGGTDEPAEPATADDPDGDEPATASEPPVEPPEEPEAEPSDDPEPPEPPDARAAGKPAGEAAGGSTVDGGAMSGRR